VAAGVLLFTAVLPTITGRPDIVLAMEKAVSQLKSYHGVMADGTEVWRDGQMWRVRYPNGNLYLVNGDAFWQEYADQKRAYRLPPEEANHLEVHLDLTRIADQALRYPHETVGAEVVAGRMTTKLLVKLPENRSYHIWIDNETNLPLQWERPNPVGTPKLDTFTTFTVNEPIDPALFAYQPPEGFRVVDLRSRIVTAQEVESVAGFKPLMPRETPLQITAKEGEVSLDFGTVKIRQWPATEPIIIRGLEAYGTAGGGPMEVSPDSLSWVQDGIHISVSTEPESGDRYIDLARQIAPDLTMPDPNQDVVSAAKVKVPVDMAEARALQEKVDQGDPRGPSLKDALNQANIYAAEKGGAEVPFESKVVINTGAQAVVEISKGSFARIYLQRLVRTDLHGIWFVVGYDPR
jgi:outer membrane lipoprotein-sorting protein